VFGLMDVKVGATTVKALLKLAVAPPGIVTVTFLALADAFDAMVNVAVTCVSLVAATLLAVTPVPDSVTAVAPVR
jgi:hypothetical protein